MMIKPLEKNNGGYFGETIVISDVLDRIATAAKIHGWLIETFSQSKDCLLYTSPSPRDATLSRMPSSA